MGDGIQNQTRSRRAVKHLVVLCLLLTSCARPQTGRVTRILDGDTLELDGERVRLALVDAPELDTAAGWQARTYLEAACPVGSNARIVRGGTDGYGRTVGKVTCGGLNLNELMIVSGNARLWRSYCRGSFGRTDWGRRAGCD